MEYFTGSTAGYGILSADQGCTVAVRTIQVGRDALTLHLHLNGLEILLLNGEEVSKLRTFRPISQHDFVVQTAGGAIPHNLRFSQFGHVLRKGGVIVSENTPLLSRLIFGYLFSLTLAMALQGVVALLDWAVPDVAALQFLMGFVSSRTGPLAGLLLAPFFAIKMRSSLRRPQPAAVAEAA